MKGKRQIKKMNSVCWNKENLIFLIMAAAVIWRTAAAYRHFTHYDDVGLLISILQSGESIWDKLHYNSVIHWTYAPVQCWITGLLINADYSYEVNLFLGRLPSLACSVLNIFLVYYFYSRKYKDKEDFYAKAAAVFMISISWELVIYASQSEPYSIGLTGLLILMLEFQDIVQKKEIKWKRLIFIGAAAGYMQYQLFIFVFCFYLAVFFVFLKDRKKLAGSVLCSIASLLLALPVIKDFLESGMLERGTNWNVGTGYQFLFQPEQFHGMERAAYILRFFSENIKIWFRSMFVYKDSIWYADLLAVCLIIMVLMGLIHEIRMRDKMNIFLLLSLFFSFVLIIFGKLTLSPSRHTLIFVPIAIHYAAASVNWARHVRAGKLIRGFYCLCYAVIFLLTAAGFGQEWKLRSNRIGTDVIKSWIEEEHPVFIGAYDWVMDLELIKIEGYEPGYGGIWKSGETLKEGDVMILYSRSKITEQAEQDLLVYSSGKELELYDASEIELDAEIEYAHGVFFNWGNGFYKYSYRVMDGT